MTAAIPTPISAPTRLWETLADELDIAPSLYEKAADRHKSLGEWLCRPESTLARFQPNVRPQGSFRYGTVIKPLFEGTSYDLDQVVVLEGLRTNDWSQAELKDRFGVELAAYARKYGMQAPESKHRCWRLPYRDEVEFHLDSLPSVPASEEFVLSLRRAGVEDAWAARAVAITDDRRSNYRIVAGEWLTSNPRGFAKWFEARAALGRREQLQYGTRASVEDIPAYEWKTPLQRAIQLLKRHRDVMFRRTPDLAPISMIITNLAASAYQGERDLQSALTGIVARMESFVRDLPPRVPNPTHPAEDYADKWRLRPILEPNFRTWIQQARTDVHHFSKASLDPDLVDKRFAIPLTEDQQRRLGRRAGDSSATTIAAPAIITSSAPRIDSAPRPWGSRRSGSATRD
jgi:hypothetical protein